MQEVNTMTITYTPLSSDEPQIRLLTLHPGQFDEDIECSLHTVSLNDNPVYEALSYLWGEVDITLPVTVDGSVIEVTTNLEAALTYLRWRQKPRILWIDAICINQQDVEEKNVQVPMMGKIYREATSTIAWFEHDNEFIIKAITWTQYYILHQTSEATLEWSEIETIASNDEDGQHIKFASLTHALLGCICILQNRYWKRMWTFQEFVLPRELPICIHGPFTFSLSRILEAIYLIDRCLWDDRMAANDTFKDETKDLWNFVQHESDRWHQNKAAITQRTAMIKRIEFAHDYSDMGSHALDLLLMETAGRRSSDPRDRIYALYGLIPALAERFPVDYSKSEKQVVVEAISWVLHTECRWLWKTFRMRPDRFTSKTLPSRCPDLECPYDEFSYGDDKCEGLEFSPSFVGVNAITADLTTLHLWSWNLGSCKVLGQVDLESFNSGRFGPARKLWAILAGLETYDNTTTQGLQHRFARLAVSHKHEHCQVSDEELIEALQAVSDDEDKLATENGEFVSKAVSLLLKVLSAGVGMACVVTSHGCVALAPIETEDGDLITLPRHPAPPLVLKKKNSDWVYSEDSDSDWSDIEDSDWSDTENFDSSNSDQDFYLMVGPARVDIIHAKGAHVDEVVSKVQELGVAKYLIH